MNISVCALAEELGCGVLKNESLSEYTTMKVGGRCGCIIKADSTGNLKKILAALNKEKEDFFVLGKGSNVIVRDEGYGGTIIMLDGEFTDISVSDNTVVCGGGASLIRVCRAAAENGLSGLEFAYGIPGTAGGGVYMNAGAYGGEIKDIIKYAEAVDPVSGEVKRFSSDEMNLSYRHSVFMENKYIITKAAFDLKKGSREDIETKMDTLIGKRREKQPLEYPSAGSTFKRPDGSYASLLIEQCGLKGMSSGGAQVSEKHSGFIINKNNASAADILELIEKVKIIVRDKTGYSLECEPIILGREAE